MEKIEEMDGRKFWLIAIDSEEIFNRVSLHSNYHEHAMSEGRDIRYVLLDDDMLLFMEMFRKAVSELWLKLGRMSKNIEEGVKYSENEAIIRLEVTANHDDNMLFSLGGFIEGFLVARILQDWFSRNKLNDEAGKSAKEAKEALASVITVIHYRKRAVKKPIDPLF